MDDNTVEYLLKKLDEKLDKIECHLFTIHADLACVDSKTKVQEVQIKSLIGNGQKGKIQILEEKVEALINGKYWILGSGAAISLGITIAGWLLIHFHVFG